MAKETGVAVYQKSAQTLFSRAKEHVIKTPKDMETATAMLSEINKIGDKVEEEREKMMRPLLDAQKVERGRWKPIETVVTEAKTLLRQAMTAYQTEAVRLAKVEEEKVAARIGDGKGHIKVETAVKKIGEIDRPETSIATSSGSVKFKTVPLFEIVDKSKIPLLYLQPDEVAIRREMLAGNQLPGVRYFTEERPVNSR